VKRKLIVPASISAEWRTFGVPRDVTVRFWIYVHAEMPEKYESVRKERDHDDRGFRHQKVIKSNTGEAFRIIIFVDDTTTADHLIITELRCIHRK